MITLNFEVVFLDCSSRSAARLEFGQQTRKIVADGAQPLNDGDDFSLFSFLHAQANGLPGGSESRRGKRQALAFRLERSTAIALGRTIKRRSGE